MPISVQQSVEICHVLRSESFWQEGEFPLEHVKKLNQEDRKLCLMALNQLENAQLSDWKSDKSSISQKRVKEVTERILKLPIREPKKPLKGFKAPFLWIARIAHSIFLWFKNTFMGRISSKKLHEQIVVNHNNFLEAKRRVKDIADDRPKIAESITKKYNQRETSLNTFDNETLKLYYRLLEIEVFQLKTELRQILIKHLHVDGLEDRKVQTCAQIVFERIKEFFPENDNEVSEPYSLLSELYQVSKEPTQKKEKIEKVLKDTLKKLEMHITKCLKDASNIVYGSKSNLPDLDEDLDLEKIDSYGLKTLCDYDSMLKEESELLTKKYF